MIKINYNIGKELDFFAPVVCKMCNIERINVDIGHPEWSFLYIADEETWYLVKAFQFEGYPRILSIK